MFIEYFCGCFPSEYFSWPGVEGVGNGFDLVRRPSREVCSLREILAK
jgi:hypothetical protein